MNKKILSTGLATFIIVGVALWYFLLRGNAPEAVDLVTAIEQLDEDLDEGGTEEISDFNGDINGTWIVDNEIGDFDFETASGSFAGFRVAEELTVGEVTAVGRSGGVAGSLTIESDALIATEITVDMTTIESNDSRREGAIRRAIGAAENPTATFVLSEPVGLLGDLTDGAQISVDAVGDLTVNGVTQKVTVTIEALIRDDGFGVVVGSAAIVWEDFDVTVPTAPIVVSVAADGVVEFQLIVAKR